jgi:hypothetical protein
LNIPETQKSWFPPEFKLRAKTRNQIIL